MNFLYLHIFLINRQYICRACWYPTNYVKKALPNSTVSYNISDIIFKINPPSFMVFHKLFKKSALELAPSFTRFFRISYDKDDWKVVRLQPIPKRHSNIYNSNILKYLQEIKLIHDTTVRDGGLCIVSVCKAATLKVRSR